MSQNKNMPSYRMEAHFTLLEKKAIDIYAAKHTLTMKELYRRAVLFYIEHEKPPVPSHYKTVKKQRGRPRRAITATPVVEELPKLKTAIVTKSNPFGDMSANDMMDVLP